MAGITSGMGDSAGVTRGRDDSTWVISSRDGGKGCNMDGGWGVAGQDSRAEWQGVVGGHSFQTPLTITIMKCKLKGQILDPEHAALILG